MIALLIRRPVGLPRPVLPLASLALFAGGWAHLCLYRRSYHAIPTIGVMFALNVAASAIVGVLLLVRRELVVRVAALGVAVTTVGFFAASRLPGGVFHFQERGLQPAPQAAVALVAELVVTTAVAASLVWDRRAAAGGMT